MNSSSVTRGLAMREVELEKPDPIVPDPAGVPAEVPAEPEEYITLPGAGAVDPDADAATEETAAATCPAVTVTTAAGAVTVTSAALTAKTLISAK
jgi:hypothetical protein